MLSVEEYEKRLESGEQYAPVTSNVGSLLSVYDTMDFQQKQTTSDKALNLGKSVYNGFMSVPRGVLRGFQWLRDVNEAQLNEAHPERMQMDEGARQLLDDAADAEFLQPYEVRADSSAERFAYDLAQGAGQLGGQLAVGLATGGYGALPAMALQIGGEEYKELREQGIDVETAGKAAAFNAAVQTPLEFIGFSKLTKTFPANSMLKQRLRHVAEDALTEGITEYLQEYPEQLSKIWAENADKSPEEIAQIIWDKLGNIHSSATYSGLIGATLGTGAGGMHLALDHKLDRSIERAMQREVYTEMTEHVESTVNRIKETGINPKYAGAVVNDNTQNQTVYVDGESLAGYAQEKGAEKVAESLGVSVEDIEKAAADGSTVDVKLGNFEATCAAFDGFFQEVKDGTAFEDGGYTPKKEQAEQEQIKRDRERYAELRNKFKAEEDRIISEFTEAGVGKQLAMGQVELLKRFAENINPDYALAIMQSYKVRRGENGEVQAGYGQFAGEKSKTVTKDAFWKVLSMDVLGKSKEEIYKETGWFKGEDGKWRYEIPDDVNKIDYTKVNEKGKATLADVYDNPALYEAYPFLKRVSVKAVDYDDPNYHGRAFGRTIEISKKDLLDDETEALYTLVHEIQHLIQDREGFASGGTAEDAREILGDRLKKDKKLSKLTDDELYENLAGEQEARYTEDRADLRLQLDQALEDKADAEEALAEAIKNKDEKAEDEARKAVFVATMQERRARQQLETLPTPHGEDAIIIFNGMEIPYRQKQEESPAGNILLAENTSIKEFRKLFDETAIHTWHTARVEHSDQKEIFGKTMKAISEVLGDIEKATSQDEITAIREKLETVAQNVFLFNQAGASEDYYAVSVRIAREVYEHHEAVVRSRARVVQDYGDVYQSDRIDRNGAEVKNETTVIGESEGASGVEQESFVPSYSIGAERDSAENRYHELYKEQIETDKRIKLDEYRPKSRSKESGFFDAVKSLMQTNGEIKGKYNPYDNVVTMFKGADASTVIHETWHFFVEEMWNSVKNGTASEQTVKDFNKLLDYAGMTMEQWENADTEGRRAAHEKLAEAGETYIMEGKAPSYDLRRVFRNFAKWLKAIYATIQRSENYAELTDEVREVFDRMLAAEDDIAHMERVNGYFSKLPDVITDNMSDETRAKVEDYIEKAREKAVDILTRRSLVNYTKERRKEIKKFKDEIRPMVEDEVSKRRVYACGYDKKDAARFRELRTQQEGVGIWTDENFIDRAFPADTNPVENEVAHLAAVVNPKNWTKGLGEVKKDYQRQADEMLQPAIDALEKGMGHGVEIIRDTNEYGEAKGDIVGRASNNATWYRKFYAEYKRRPTKAELREMARDLIAGNGYAPEVDDWAWETHSAEDAEYRKAEGERLADIERHIKACDEIKEKLAEVKKNYSETSAAGSEEFLFRAELTAEQYGYSSADEMMQDIEKSPTKAEAVKRRINERVQELTMQDERNNYEAMIRESLYNEDEALLIGVEQQLIEEYAAKLNNVGEMMPCHSFTKFINFRFPQRFNAVTLTSQNPAGNTIKK